MSDHGIPADVRPIPKERELDPEIQKKFLDALQKWKTATEADQDGEAMALSIELVSLAMEQEAKNPSPEVALKDQANECESRGEWTRAEELHREVLRLAEASENPARICGANVSLARLLRIVGRAGEGRQLARAGFAAVRHFTTAVNLPNQALRAEAACALDAGDPAAALAAADEAVRILRPEKILELTRGSSLILRARCRLAMDDITGAGADLAAARELLEPSTRNIIPPGRGLILGRWWEVQADFETRVNNLPAAREAIEAAIERGRQDESADGLANLARALATLADVASGLEDWAVAESARREAAMICKQLRLPAV